MPPRTTPADLAASYRDAFKAANGYDCDVTYQDGWFFIQTAREREIPPIRYRAIKLARMRDRLLERAEAAP